MSYSNRVSSGSTSARNDQPSIMADLVGTHPRPRASITVSNTAVAICGIEVVNTAAKEMIRSSREPSFMPASTPKVRAMGIMTKNTKKARIAGVRQALLQKRRDRHVLLGRTAEIAVRDGAQPLNIACEEGPIQPLFFQPLVIIGLRQGGDAESAEFGDRGFLAELVAVEDCKQQQRNRQHDQQHLSHATGDEFGHIGLGSAHPDLVELHLAGRVRPCSRAPSPTRG